MMRLHVTQLYKFFVAIATLGQRAKRLKRLKNLTYVYGNFKIPVIVRLKLWPIVILTSLSGEVSLRH